MACRICHELAKPQVSQLHLTDLSWTYSSLYPGSLHTSGLIQNGYRAWGVVRINPSKFHPIKASFGGQEKRKSLLTWCDVDWTPSLCVSFNITRSTTNEMRTEATLLQKVYNYLVSGHLHAGYRKLLTQISQMLRLW